MSNRDTLKNLILYCAEKFIDEYDLTQEQIIAIDNFADLMLEQLDILQDKIKEKK